MDFEVSALIYVYRTTTFDNVNIREGKTDYIYIETQMDVCV